jgi:serine/threonine-protein kinase HipA
VSTKKLIVWWDGRVVGDLSRRPNGGERFTYNEAWLNDPLTPALSLSLPKSGKKFSWSAMSPFFDGLLPEGASRRAIARVLQVSPENDFSILERLGGDVAGAIQFLLEGETPCMVGVSWVPKLLTDEQLLAMIQSLPLRPMLLGESGIRLSLAGAQTKLPVVLVDDRVAKPDSGQPTTHILKPAAPAFDGIVENEAFCMMLADAVKLRVAEVQPRLLQVPGEPALTYLLVRRYDRGVSGGHVVRLHQEDFCQALGVASRMKYQADGGPNLKKLFRGVWEYAYTPAADIMQLIGAVVLNVVVGNEDAHGKNFSLLYGAKGQISLAPLYDLVSTVVYDNLDHHFAMKVGHARTLEELNPHEWQRFAQDADVELSLVRTIVNDVCESVQVHASGIARKLSQPGMDSAFLAALANTVMRRAKACSATIPRRGGTLSGGE